MHAKKPVLMLSAKSVQDKLDEAASYGNVEHLKKPFDPEELVRVVHGILSKQECRDELDFDSDPEMAELKRDYMSSFPERIRNIQSGLAKLLADPQSRDGFIEAKKEIHKLAGTAATYGVPDMSQILGVVDDYFFQILDGNLSFDSERVIGLIQKSIEVIDTYQKTQCVKVFLRDQEIVGLREVLDRAS